MSQNRQEMQKSNPLMIITEKQSTHTSNFPLNCDSVIAQGMII
ncbi:MAG: hypothetical protein RIM23_03780 [Coleofasciculus sp. G3-WIS-01]